eukprot:1148355-Pelagomonas_calceolata.AAC.3
MRVRVRDKCLQGYGIRQRVMLAGVMLAAFLLQGNAERTAALPAESLHPGHRTVWSSCTL